MLALKTLLSHNPDCPVREIGDGLVIMAPQGETTHSLDGIGAFIWNHIDGNKALDDILADILSEYEVGAQTAEQDLQTFITQLMEAGLVLPV